MMKFFNNWNWGKGLAVGLAVFVAIWASIYIFALRQNFDLVTPNYYEKELKYQQEIDRQNNSTALKGKVSLSQTAAGLKISFPVAEVGMQIAGIVTFYRPSDSKYDKSVPLSVDSSGTALISLENMKRGKWKVQIQWQTPSQRFSDAEDLMVQ